MSRSLAKELIKIWHLPSLDNIDLETTPLPMIKKILRIYGRAQDCRIHLSEMINAEKIHEIKGYQKSGCLSPEKTDIDVLYKRFFITERTLRIHLYHRNFWILRLCILLLLIGYF